MTEGWQAIELSSLFGEATARALRGWQEQTGRSVRVIDRMTGGRTAAGLLIVLIEGPGEPARKVVVKVWPPGLREQREPARHREALRDAPGRFADRYLVHQPHEPVPIDESGWLLFQDVADGSLAQMRPLGDLLGRDRLDTACRRVVKAVLGEWNPGYDIPETSVPDLLRAQLGQRLAPDGPLTAWAASEAPTLGDANWITLPGEPDPLPNPIVLAGATQLNAGLTVHLLTGRAHGDLHLGNILLAQRPGADVKGFRLIDLSRYSPVAPLARDPQHLLLSIVAECLAEWPASIRDALLDCLADAASESEARLPVWLRDTILAVREESHRWVSRHGLVDEWLTQSRLSLMACALMFVARGTISSQDRRWFFRLAARSAAAYLRSVGRYAPTPPRGVFVGASREPGPAVEPAPLLDTEQRQRLHRLLAGVRVTQVAAMYRDAVGPFGPRLAADSGDIGAVLRELEQVNMALDGTPPLFRFVERVSAQVDDPPAEALRGWVDSCAPWLRVDEQAVRNLRGSVAADTKPDQRSYVIIQLQEDGLDADRYLMSVWLQPAPDDWVTLRLDDRPHQLQLLPAQLDELLEGVPDLASGAEGGFSLEFVLPRRLLGRDVDQWHIAGRTGIRRRLGIEFPVVVRSLERIQDRSLHHEWHRKWRWFQANGEIADARVVRWAQDQEPADQEALISQLMADETPVCLVLSGAPGPERTRGQEELLAGLHAGMPIILWSRDDHASLLELRALVTDHGLRQLPEAVLRLRRMAVGGAQHAHLGFHLSLLWDDPTRIPDSLVQLRAPA